MTYRPAPGWEKALAEGAEMRAGLKAPANRVVDAIRSVAPERTGFFKASVHVEVHADGVFVATDDPKWPYLEYGTSDTPRFAPLRRGLERAGVVQ